MTLHPLDDRARLRGRDVRHALQGEQPVKASPVTWRGVSVGVPTRDVRLLIAAVTCGLLALACAYALVSP